MCTPSKYLRQRAWRQKNTIQKKCNRSAENLFLKMLQQEIVSWKPQTAKKLQARLTAQFGPACGVIILTPRSQGGGGY